jgi:hypothetical protein
MKDRHRKSLLGALELEHGDSVSHTSHPSKKSFIPMLYIGDTDRLEALMVNVVSLL